MLVDGLASIFLLLSGILAGVLFTVDIAIVPTIRTLEIAPYKHVHMLLDKRFDPMMPTVNKIALAICLALVILANGVGAKVAFGAAGLCIIGVAIVSEAFNVRMNRTIGSWDTSTPPADWAGTRSRWASANRIRTLIAAAGFIATIVAMTLK